MRCLHACVATLTLALWASAAIAASVADEAYLGALERGDLDAAARLIDAGVNLDAQRADGKTLLILAAKEGDVGLVRRLVAAGADVDVTTGNGGTALMFAAIKGDIDTQSALLDAGADVNAVGGFDWTALMVAAVKGHEAAVRQLLANGADQGLRDVYGWTPLMRAVYEEREQIVAVLLDAPGVDLARKNDQGATALHLAAVKGNERLARALLEAGANPAIRDRGGRTPAELAAKEHHRKVAELLGDRNAN